jgi:hypothetical protein
MIFTGENCSNKDCEFNNIRKHYHSNGNTYFLEDNEIFCTSCNKTEIKSRTLDNIDNLGIETLFPSPEGTYYDVKYQHCPKCCKHYASEIKENNFREIEYDCCFYKGNRSSRIIKLDHVCNEGAITKSEENYSMFFLFSPRFYEVLCDPCTDCRRDLISENIGKKTFPYGCFESMLCFWNPLFCYRASTWSAKFSNDHRERIELVAWDYYAFQNLHRCFLNNNPCYLLDCYCNRNDNCFNFFVQNDICQFLSCSSLIQKRYKLKTKCLKNNCTSYLFDDEIHCEGCNKHFNINDVSHCKECCVKKSIYAICEEGNYHCRKCHQNYLFGTAHCCECKEIYDPKLMVHCHPCGKTYSKDEIHCCGCRMTYTKRQFHCHKCKCVCSNTDNYTIHCSCCKTYDKTKFFHCKTCHCMYRKLDNCPVCSKNSNFEKCYLCAEDLGNVYCETQCKHSFHENCIKEWLKFDNKKCPTCNKEHGFSNNKFYEADEEHEEKYILNMIHRK